MFGEEKAAIRVGVFVVVAVLVVVLGVALGRGWGFRSFPYSLYVVFPAVPGLEIGDPVTVNGLQRGRVVQLQAVEQGVVVKLGMENLGGITLQDQPALVMLEITGGRKIEILTTGRGRLVRSGDTLQGKLEADIATLLTTTSRFVQQSSLLLARLERLLERMDTTVLAESSLQMVQELLYHVTITTRRIAQFADRQQKTLESLLMDSERFVRRLNDLVTRHRATLDTILYVLSTESKHLSPLIRRSYATLSQADSLIRDIRDLIATMRSDTTLIGRLLNDATLSHQLDSTLQAVDRLVQQIRQYGINVNVRLGTRP